MESVPQGELDIEDAAQLRVYLAKRRLTGDTEPVAISRLAGGVSSRTMLVERPNGERWVIKQALAALRVHVEWLSSPERSAREAEGARALASMLPEGAVPRIVFEDREHHLFGMEAAPAQAANWKSMLLAGDSQIEHFRAAGELLACIHRESAKRAGEFGRAFEDRSFFESLRLEPYYEYTAREAPAAGPFLSALCDETRAARLSLVHGDFSPKNLLVVGDRLILLDHEVIHFGDPAFDLGFAMAHFLSKAHHLSGWRERLLAGAAEFRRSYESGTRWRQPVERRAAAHTLGCLLARVAGRSQLEYLSQEEKRRQREACIRLMAEPPAGLGELASRFMGEVK